MRQKNTAAQKPSPRIRETIVSPFSPLSGFFPRKQLLGSRWSRNADKKLMTTTVPRGSLNNSGCKALPATSTLLFPRFFVADPFSFPLSFSIPCRPAGKHGFSRTIGTLNAVLRLSISTGEIANANSSLANPSLSPCPKLPSSRIDNFEVWMINIVLIFSPSLTSAIYQPLFELSPRLSPPFAFQLSSDFARVHRVSFKNQRI